MVSVPILGTSERETTQDELSKLVQRAETPTALELRIAERKAARARIAETTNDSVATTTESNSVTPVTRSAARLDQGLPYGRVFGGAVVYEQNGKLFNVIGYEIDASGKMVDEHVVLTGDEPRVGQFVPVVTDENGIVSYHRMTSSQLIAVLESYGEEYTTREAAIALLEGHREAT